MNKLVKISEQESKAYSLVIGRAEQSSEFSFDRLAKEIIELNIDVCKLKLKVNDPEVFSKLNHFAFPVSYYSLLFRHEISLNEMNISQSEYPDDFVFVNYDFSMKTELKNLVEKILNYDGMNLYYKNKDFHELISDHLIRKTIAEYQTSFDNTIDSNKYCFLAYNENKLIGFCSLEITNKVGVGVFVGILPEYRSKNLFKLFVQKEIEQSRLVGCDKFVYDVIVFNHRSLNTSIKEGMNIKDVYLNIHIISVLSSSVLIESVSLSNIDIVSHVLNLLHKYGVVIEMKFNKNENSEIIKKWKILVNVTISPIIFFNISKNEYGYVKYS
jgi:hypothetical protein